MPTQVNTGVTDWTQLSLREIMDRCTLSYAITVTRTMNWWGKELTTADELSEAERVAIRIATVSIRDALEEHQISPEFSKRILAELHSNSAIMHEAFSQAHSIVYEEVPVSGSEIGAPEETPVANVNVSGYHQYDGFGTLHDGISRQTVDELAVSMRVLCDIAAKQGGASIHSPDGTSNISGNNNPKPGRHRHRHPRLT